MAERYLRTEAGRREIRERAVQLTRPGRNLLLIIDASKTAAEWLAAVHGCTEADLRQLIDSGLIASALGQASAGRTLEQALQERGYRELYDLLTQQARPRLGLIKGYKVVLEVERCSGAEQIRALAQRFVDLVREVQGEAEARLLRRRLGADG